MPKRKSNDPHTIVECIDRWSAADFEGDVDELIGRLIALNTDDKFTKISINVDYDGYDDADFCIYGERPETASEKLARELNEQRISERKAQTKLQKLAKKKVALQKLQQELEDLENQ